MTAHESDEDALDRGRQSATLDHLEVDTRRGKTGATGDEKVGDAVAFIAQIEPIDGRYRELRCVDVEGAHPFRRARTAAVLIKAARGIDARIAMGNAGHLRHAIESVLRIFVVAEKDTRHAQK